MISVGSSDGRKVLGLGFGIGGDMEETEVEEGEACYYQNDDDSAIDPDVALSYIDEKLQDVLGHFQKDFEGGVSAENLGAKFGGYGSFLPTYQRSPAWSHQRTPPKMHNYNTPRSPNHLHLEGGHHNSAVASSASLSVRPVPASVSAVSLPTLKAPSVHDSVKRDVCMSSTHAEEFTPARELINRSANRFDQKTLKVRIKVGSDNLSTRKKAEIYSGLGLDVSPSSSLDNSPTDSEGLCCDSQNAPDESPTSILQMMTSFPVLGSLLLSPLPNGLIHLVQKEKLWHESRSGVHTGSQESSLIFMSGSDSARDGRENLREKKPKQSEKYAVSVDLKNDNVNDGQNGSGVLLNKETDIDTSTCEELVSNALRLPLLSNSYCNVKSAKGTAKTVDISRLANKCGVTDECSSDLAKEEPSETLLTQANIRVEKHNGQIGSDGKVRENKKTTSDDGDSVCLRKGGNPNQAKTDFQDKGDSNVSKGRKALHAELKDPQNQKTGQKATSREEDDMKMVPGKEWPASGGKRKSKGSRSHGTQYAEVPKNGLKIDYSSLPKSRKSTNVDSYVSKSEGENLKKDYGKARERYKDFFGDLELEQEDNEKASEEMSCEDRLKDSALIEKSKLEFDSAPKERLNVRKIEKVSSSEAYPRVASHLAPPTGNGSISNGSGAVATVKEDWVCCDKCQKWRLLPLGTNPDSLPEKWLCSMLNWLPGMNRCSISEEETTKALISQYQVPAPAPEGQTMQHGPGGILLGVSPADARHFDQNSRDLGLHAVSTGEKKKQGLKDVSDATYLDGPTQISNSMKKNLQASVKSKSLNGVNQSPTVNEVDFQHSGQSSSLVAEKRRHKQKENNKLLESYSGGGDTMKLKTKNKRDTDQDCFRSSKKMKANGMHYTDDDGMPEIGGAVLKVRHSTSSDLSMNLIGKDQRKYNDRPMASKRDSKSAGITDDSEVVKKRKRNECQDTHNYTMSFPTPENHLQVSRDFIEEISENDHRKEKKARASKSGGKENFTSKGSGRSDRKGRSVKDQQLGTDPGSTLTRRSLDATDSLKKDMRSVEPSLAATSSSSKVSGSHKNKANLQEVKGSPVESVSSSPLRVSNPDKFTSTRRNLRGKYDSLDAAFFATGSPRKCSDGEDDGGSDRSGTVRKGETFTGTHRESLESSVLDFQDRDLGRTSGSKAKAEVVPFPEFATHHITNGNVDTLVRGAQYPCKTRTSDQCHNEEIGNDNQYHASGSRQRKSGKGSSSRSKDKSRSFRSGSEKSDLNFCESFKESIDPTGYDEKSKAEKNKVQEKYAVNSDKVEKNLISKKDSTGKGFGESAKRDSHSKFGRRDGSDVRVEAISSQGPKQNLLLDRDGERSSKRFPLEKSDRLDVSGRGKSHSLPPSGRGQNETLRCPQPISGSQKENGATILAVHTYEGDDALKAPKPIKKAENQNGNQSDNLKHPTPNGKKTRDVDAPSPARRDSSSQAATKAVKEAKDLKHLADRVKNSGSNSESTVLYFQAALKFLHGASLLESCSGESTKHCEMIQSIQIYRSTAKLCEFCAHEYEKSKDLAAAALAYKCTEVAYMRVVYSSHSNAGRDRHELQTALQIVPPGESPSSSASDIDNLNNATTADKVALPKGLSSPQVAGNHVIAARNRPNFVRLLNFAQDVNFAMEASRKSRIAFAAANSKLKEALHREAAASVKRALDFSFQDVEGFLRLVRVAMEAMSLENYQL